MVKCRMIGMAKTTMPKDGVVGGGGESLWWRRPKRVELARTIAPDNFSLGLKILHKKSHEGQIQQHNDYLWQTN